MTALAIFDAMRTVLPEIASKSEGFIKSKTYKDGIIFTMRDAERFGREYVFRFAGKDNWSLSTKKKGEK